MSSVSYLSQRRAAEEVKAHMKTVLDDDAPPFQHPFAGHDVEQTLEALLKCHELLHLQVTRSQLRSDAAGWAETENTHAV